MKTIFLVGYMGSGKTTLGRALNAKTGINFIDLDEHIERQQAMTVKQIFASKGEAAFRQMERDAIAELAEQGDLIVACGGGTPCFFDNMERMNRAGITIYLQASVETLASRLAQARAQRPLIADMDDESLRRFIVDSLRQRLPFYSLASNTFCTDNLDDLPGIEDSVNEFVAKYISL